MTENHTPKKVFLCILAVFVFLPFITKAQISPSSQVKFTTPTTLSSCSRDTILLELSNQKGEKGATYSEKTTIEIDIPGGTLIQYLTASVSSVPSGATVTSYVANKLTISVPLPSLGTSTKIKFVVKSDCNINTLTNLPYFTAKVTYPASYPLTPEIFNSAFMNVAKGVLSVTNWNPIPVQYNFNTQIGWSTRLTNIGYGNISEIKETIIVPNKLNPNASGYTSVYMRNENGTTPYMGIAYYTSKTVYGADSTQFEFVYSGNFLGSDGLLTPGEALLAHHHTVGPSYCTSGIVKHTFQYSCGAGFPACETPVTYYANHVIQGGSPKLDGTLISAEDPDGCPNKIIKYKVKNTGTGNANPVGNAYDVDLNINFGGAAIIKVNDLKMNGIPVPVANISPTTATNNVKIRLKDFMTTDPDGAGGISDFDGDGYFDDMIVGAETNIEFTYTFPCAADACGTALFSSFASNATFTDYCKTLNGVTYTWFKNFGFQQIQPITLMKKVDFSTLTTGQSKVDTAKFNFQYKYWNVNMSAATAKLVIRYSKRMELNLASIKFNGAPFSNTPVLSGTNTNTNTDKDSMAVINLTNAEITALFDAVPDSLHYAQTYYGCTERQMTTTGDNWSLLINIKPTKCADSTFACTYDLACRQPWSYSGTYCSGKPGYVTSLNFKRLTYAGHTAVDESTPITIDANRAYIGDTVQLTQGAFINGFVNMEPNGYWYNKGNPFRDLRNYFSMTYTKPKGWLGKTNPWIFLPQYSQVIVRLRTPVPGNANSLGTLGATVFTAPILLEDFAADSRNVGATTQSDYPTKYNARGGAYGSVINGEGWYCTTGNPQWEFSRICPVRDGFYTGSYKNIAIYRRTNLEDTKIAESYYLNFGKALARAGWVGNPGDPQYYFEVQTKWRMDNTFPFDNFNDLSLRAATQHLGTFTDFDFYAAASTYNGPSSEGTVSGLAVTKEHSIKNPNQVYSAACGLRASHKVFFKSQEGNYFRNGEVRVPLKIDSIVVDLPTEYNLSAISLAYHQNCAVQTSTTITSATTTGHVVFKNGTTDFPRADDCSGNMVAYDLSYDLTKTGSAAPAQYTFNVKIYGRDEFNNVILLTDKPSIAEGLSNLTLTPLTPILQNNDGGACELAYFDFQIQNNSLYDAPNTYFAAESSATTIIKGFTDAGNIYDDPISIGDTSKYLTNNIFVKLGTIKTGEIRKIRVYANTNICADNFQVYTDYGCTYPTLLKPNLASGTIKNVTASYVAATSSLLIRPIANIDVLNLCDNKTVEIEVKNANFANINKLLAAFQLPANSKYVTATAQIKYPNTATYVVIPATNISSPVRLDSLLINLNNVNPFSTTCGLTGADTATLNNFRLKFDIEFTSCPTTGSSSVLCNFESQNYCGTKITNRGIVPVYFIGSTNTQNNYELSYNNAYLQVCTANNVTENITDIVKIKNLGGYSSSGLSSGTDNIDITIPIDANNFTLANFTLPAAFAAPTFTTDAQGNIVLHTKVPAGIAVGASINMPISFDLTAKKDKLCLEGSPQICYFAFFNSNITLACAAKSLSCSSFSTTPRGSSLVFRKFKCCDITLGNKVWLDSNKNGKQDAGEAPIEGVKVALYKNSIKIATTSTDANGEYYFTNKNQSSITWLGTIRDTAILPLTNYDIVFGETQYNNGKLTVASTGYLLTIANEASSDLTDNDAILNTIAGGSYPSILNILSPNTGNDYSLDAGFQCPEISNPSAMQVFCAGITGSDITVNTNFNIANSIKFVKFTSNQIAINGNPTAAELSTIDAGTAIATVTPTGAISPYTATYTFVNSDFLNTGTTTIDYYIYAILANDINGICRPAQEIKVTVYPLPSFVIESTNITCYGERDGTITLKNVTGTSPFQYSIDDGITFEPAINTTTKFYTNLPAAVYKPAVKDANGCTRKCN
jgi:hypothetical protein